MKPLKSMRLKTAFGEKEIAVCCGDILELDEPLDVMMISAFHRRYGASPGTLIAALEKRGICVQDLARHPAMDLRDACGVWLSNRICGADLPITRIGCLELSPYQRDHRGWYEREDQILASISSCFRMLEIASIADVSKIRTVGMTVFGGGRQGISMDLTAIPILSECTRFLRENADAERVLFITNNREQAERLAGTLTDSYSGLREVQARQASEKREEEMVFLSYSSEDVQVAEDVYTRVKARGVPVWYAPNSMKPGQYASEIVDAISRCTKFAVIGSRNSMKSPHVLNEVNLANEELRRNITIYILRIDNAEKSPEFKYYLSRHHWTDATERPLEKYIEEFADLLTEK